MNAEKPAESLYFTSGSMFVAPGQQSWDLVDLKIVGGAYDTDTISFIKDGYAVVDPNKVFYYISEEEAGDETDYIGWWYVSGENEGDKVVSFPVPSGTGFLCKFFNEGTKISYAGEVIVGSNGEIEIERAENQLYNFIVNPTPGALDLTQIKVSGGAYDTDTFSLIKTNYAVVDPDKVFYYISEEEAGDETDYIGWWYVSGEHEGDKVEEGDVTIGAGEGMLAKTFNEGTKVIFPSPIK